MKDLQDFGQLCMLLAAFQALAHQDLGPKHNLRFVWQRAEENPGAAPNPESGAHRLVAEGVLDGIASVYGLHVWATGKAGTFLSRPGRIFANSDRLGINLHCSGGHVALPQNGSNAIDIGLQICNTLSGFPLRFLGPLEQVSLVPAVFQAGTSSNIRPADATIWFAVRNFLEPQRREAFMQAVMERVRQTVGMYPDATVDFTPVTGHPAMANTPAECERISGLLQAANQPVTGIDPLLGGEDFAYYLLERPGCFYMLGAGDKDSADHHTPKFNPDPLVLWKGVLYWLLLATN